MKYVQLVKAIGSASQQLLGQAATVVNQALVIRNWMIGAYIVEFEQNGEDRAQYGGALLETLSRDLSRLGLKGLSSTNLKQCRQCYRAYPQIGRTVSGLLSETPTLFQIRQTLSDELIALLPQLAKPIKQPVQPITPLSPQLVLRFSWSKLLELIRLDDPLKRAFYENECLKGNWSVRQLQRQIGSLLYERTGLSTDKKKVILRARKQAAEAPLHVDELIRDPYVLEFTGLAERPDFNETELESALLDHLQAFLLELGTGFCFEARQMRITLDNEHDYIDLVFYHRILRFHLLLDLKVRPFKHGDAGQMNFYLNYFKDRMMVPGDHPPVGIILCSDRRHTKVEYATAGINNPLFVSRYLVALPKPEQLQALIENDRAQFEAANHSPDVLKKTGILKHSKKLPH